jgi:hypothetical protein
MHLFTPVGERAWVPHWDPVFPAGEHGDGSAPDTVFLTGDTHWVVTHRTAGHVRYARVTPGVRAGTVDVRVRPDGATATAEVTYEMTPLAAGDDYDPAIREWEAAIAAAIGVNSR